MIQAEEFLPIGDQVLLKRTEENDIQGGVIMPETHEGKQLKYIVVATKPDEDEFKPGDVVVAPPDGGHSIHLTGHGKCEIIERRRIMAIIPMEEASV